MDSTFCPRCGTVRIGGFRFCRMCGLDFDALPPALPTPTFGTPAPVLPPTQPASTWPGRPIPPAAPETTPATPAANVELLRLATVVGWLVSAALMAWLALVQFGFTGTIIDDGSLVMLAGWNALIAALMVYGSVRLYRSSSRRSFRSSAIWALVILLLQGAQIVMGATHFAYVGSTVAAGLAGVLAWMTYGTMPEPEGSSPK